MNPQKVALVSSSRHLGQAITNSLGLQEPLFITENLEGISDHSVILLHYDPPISNCLEWIPMLKKAQPLRPIVVIGNSSAPHDVAEAFRFGANDFLFEPLEEEVLLNCLHRHQLSQEAPHKSGWWQKWLPWWIMTSEAPMSIVSKNFQKSQNLQVKLLPKPDLEVQFFGSLSLIFKGKTVQKLPGKKAKSLLAYLLYQYPKAVHRDVLMEKFWGDSTPDSARNCLNVTLHAIRKSFEETADNEEVIIYENECYRFREDLVVERDIDLFESYWKKGQKSEQLHGIQEATDTYHQAFAFYRGDLLEDLLYEDWAFAVREKYRETWLVILDRLSVHFYEKGKYQISKNLCQKMVEKDPCLEDVHRRIMDCYAQMKMPDMAIRQFHKCRDILKKELNVNPGRATWDLFLSIRDA